MADPHSPDFDAAVLRFLAVTPGIEHWRDTTLPPKVQRWLTRASDDELLSVIAAALQRLSRRPAA